MADIALDRTQADAVAGSAVEYVGQALYLDHIADAGTGAVRFDQGSGSRVEAGMFPGALDGKLLADRVGRGDAFAFAVAGPADPTYDGVNPIACLFRVRQPFQDEGGGALAHDKAVRALAEWSAAGRAERADLAEFDEAGSAHIAVHPAGDHGIHLMLAQHLHCRLNGCEARRAGGVGDEVRAT